MRAICCAILASLFLKLAKSKVDGAIIMTASDQIWATIWGTLFYVSTIAAVVLCCLGL